MHDIVVLGNEREVCGEETLGTTIGMIINSCMPAGQTTDRASPPQGRRVKMVKQTTELVKLNEAAIK